MNSRLEPAVWTWEDMVAWGRFMIRFGTGPHFPQEFQDMGPNADSRDADLMWSWQCQEMETLFTSRLERLLWLGIGLPVEYSA